MSVLENQPDLNPVNLNWRLATEYTSLAGRIVSG